MEFLLSWIILIVAVYCLYNGLPVSWLRRIGYIKYRIVFTTKESTEGCYILQESCFGIIWRRAKFDNSIKYLLLADAFADIESPSLEPVKKAKKLAQEWAAEAQRKFKAKKITKIIE
jgi:hypothetical protein